MKDHRLWGLVLVAVACMVLTACGRKPFYTVSGIEQMLEERYNLPFEVQALVDETGDNRTYQVTSSAYPDLTFYAEDHFYAGGWLKGANGVLSMYSRAKRTLLDSCRSVVWNGYAIPILAEYGIQVPEADPYSYQYFPREDAVDYTVTFADDFEAQAEVLYELSSRLNALPIFKEMPPASGPGFRNSNSGSYAFRLTLVVAEDIPGYSNGVYLTFPYPYTEQAILDTLADLRTGTIKNMTRALRELDTLESVLSGLHAPVIGDNFFAVEDFLPEMRCEETFPAEAGWAPVVEMIEEKTGEAFDGPLCYLGRRDIEGTLYACVSDVSPENIRFSGQIGVFLVEVRTGRVYQYVFNDLNGLGYIVTTPHSLPVNLLEQWQA